MATDHALATENYQHYAYARDKGHVDYVRKARRCTDFVTGQQWEKSVEQALKAVGKPVITVNKVLTTLATIEGEQIQSQFDIALRPLRNGANYSVADALNGVWLSISAANMLPFKVIDVFDMGARTSRGFFDLRVEFDDNWMGEVRITTLNGRNVLIDPDAEDMDPDTWNEVFITKWLSPDTIEQTYGQRGIANDLMNREKSVYELGYDSIDDISVDFGQGIHNTQFNVAQDRNRRRHARVIERQFRELKVRPHFVNPTTGDMRPVPINWSHEQISQYVQLNDVQVVSRKSSGIKWLTTCEEFVLFNKESPLKHFTPIPFFPFLIDGKTIGLVENALSPQELLNKVTSQELHVVNTTANSGWQMEEDQLVNMTSHELERKGATTGLVIVRRANTNPLEKIQPNQVPSGLDRVAFNSERHLKDALNVSESQRGFDRADVSGRAIEQKRSAGSVNLTKPFSNLLRTMAILVRNTTDLVQMFYTEERLIHMTGGASEDTGEDEQMVVNQMTPEGTIVNDLTLGEYEVVAAMVPPRDTLDDTVFDEVKAMRLEMGIAIPDEFVIEASRLPKKGRLLKAMREAQAANANEAAQAMQQLELQLKQLEGEKLKAEVMKFKADAALAVMRAQQAGKEAAGDDGQAEANAELQKLALDRERMLADIEMQRQKVVNEIELAREKMRAEIQLERAKAAAASSLAEETAATNRKIAEENAETQRDVTKKNAETQAAVAKQKAAASANKPKAKRT